MSSKVAAAILAGGRARRLGGVWKGGLDIGGRTIVAREAAALARISDERLLVIGAQQSEMDFTATQLGMRVVIDRAPGQGPLSGLDAAFAATTADTLLVVGCDLPFLDER